ncbi:SAGA-associated factor 29 isoform X1 [Globicephala melas]|uniref:SAGA-associated factor 29 isoform X1 n=1 Tax=Globicephala melas TaxID=9731 RepID=UPI00293D7BA9|nr:SAGA-associated factor 29 isoform X1 [Globicephala melas]
MALVSADSRIAELLTELHQLIKQTQEERSRSEHNLVNIQKTHERMQTENKISPYYRTKLRGLYTTAKADAEAECNILRKALDKIAEIKSLLEERRIAAKIAGLYNDSEPPRKTMRRGVLMTLLQQSAMTLPLWIGKPGDKPPPLCGAIPASGDYVAKPGDKVAARVKAVDGDEQWILAEVVSYSHATNKYEVDDIDEEGKERHTLSRRRIIPLPQWKANPETDPEALFQKEQLVLALYPQTTCFYRALIHTPPQRSTGSRHAGFSSCGARACLLRGMWDLPEPGIEPVSPAPAGGFLIALPPGKSPSRLSLIPLTRAPWYQTLQLWPIHVDGKSPFSLLFIPYPWPFVVEERAL